MIENFGHALADGDHAVDTRAAAKRLARGPVDGTMVDACTGFGAETPVEFAADIEEPVFGDQNSGLQVSAARFGQSA